MAIVYGDYECPFCAAVEARLHGQPLRVAFRHFPVRGSHPRALPAALAVIGPDGVVKWSYRAPSPSELPGANLIFDALD